jgi:hypothetical protein
MTAIEPDGSPLLDTYAAARMLGLRHPGTLCNWRSKNQGPAFIRVGRNIRYSLEDLQAWVDEHRVSILG